MKYKERICFLASEQKVDNSVFRDLALRFFICFVFPGAQVLWPLPEHQHFVSQGQFRPSYSDPIRNWKSSLSAQGQFDENPFSQATPKELLNPTLRCLHFQIVSNSVNGVNGVGTSSWTRQRSQWHRRSLPRAGRRLAPAPRWRNAAELKMVEFALNQVLPPTTVTCKCDTIFCEWHFARHPTQSLEEEHFQRWMARLGLPWQISGFSRDVYTWPQTQALPRKNSYGALDIQSF